MAYHLKIISKEFGRRVQRNSRYSLRAYASALNLHPSALSRILAGKQEVSLSSSLEISEKLKLADNDRRLFLLSVLEARNTKDCERLGDAIATPGLKPAVVKVEEQAYEKINSLHAGAIMELTLVEDFKNCPTWMARRLQLSEAVVLETLSALLNVGVLKIENGRLQKTYLHTTCVDENRTNEIRRGYQKEILLSAVNALEQIEFCKRGHYGMVMAVDPSKLPEANKKIQNFIQELCDFLEAGERTEVYQLGVQLFPLTNVTSQEKM